MLDDISTVLSNPAAAKTDTVRQGVLFNSLALATVDGAYLKPLLDGTGALKPGGS